MDWGLILGIGLIIAITIAILFSYKVMKKKNEFVYYSEDAEKWKANVDIHLEKQYDAITSLLGVLNAHGDRELKFSKEVTLARGKNQTVFDKSAGIDMAMQKINQVYYATPRISSDPMYRSLMGDIKKEAENVAVAKKRYMSAASSYNKRISMAPYSYFAQRWGHEKKELFSAQTEKIYDTKEIFK